MTLATKQRGENVVVPRLALPCPETGVRPDDVGSPTFRRQLTVALGRSHSQRTPRRDVIFRIHQGSMVEKKQKLPLEESVLAKTGRHYDGRGSAHRRASVADKVSATARSRWTTTAQAFAPAFSPCASVHPRAKWYEDAGKVFRFFGYIVDQVEPTARKVPLSPRLVAIQYYPQDSTLEMLESKETATPGVGRTLAFCRPSRVSLADLRVGNDVLINGTRVQIYDADGFTRRSITGLGPPEHAPSPDRTFSVTPRRVPPTYTHHRGSRQETNLQDQSGSLDGGRSRGPSDAPSSPWEIDSTKSFADVGFLDSSTLGDNTSEILRMFIRWDDSASAFGKVHRYILNYFLEDGTIEMREVADVKGGHHFQGRFPVMIRRQRVCKEGKTPNLGVDNVGFDWTTPRSTRRTGSGRLGLAGSKRVVGAGGVKQGVEESLCPQDMLVGQTVLLMKRPMTVCGWDEISHVWWENFTGTSMRMLQGDLEDFRQCMRPSRSNPRPPNRSKSCFYEGPPQRPGTVRGRFIKASENSGKTLRFLAKATPDTETTSTRDNLFIIRFYPADDTLSVYTSHNLGSNAGGVFKGVYLARTGAIVNEATGKVFKAGDFQIGVVAKLPSVSLKVVDVDDFSRHYLSREILPPDIRWQTAPLWQKLLGIVAGDDAGVNGTAHGPARSPRPPCKAVCFARREDTNSRAFVCEGTSQKHSTSDAGYRDGDSIPIAAGGVDPRAGATAFACLWAQCIGDDTCSGFSVGGSNVAVGGCRSSNSDSSKVDIDEAGENNVIDPSRQPNHATAPSPCCLSASPWKRLVTALGERGIDLAKVLTAHEYTLLSRELADSWSGQGRGLGRGQGMAERLASAAAAAAAAAGAVQETGAGALMHPSPTTKAAKEPSQDIHRTRSTDVANPVLGGDDLVGGAAHARRRRLSVGGLDFPAVVVGGPEASLKSSGEKEGHTRVAEGAKLAARSETTRNSKLERQLDLRSVALDSHQAPTTGRCDQIVRKALAKILPGVFGHRGDATVVQVLKDEGKTPGDPADLWTTSRLLMAAAGLSRRDTEALWLKFMPAAVAKAGRGGRVTFAGFLETIKAFEACLRRGEVLGLSNIGPGLNYA